MTIICGAWNIQISILDAVWHCQKVPQVLRSFSHSNLSSGDIQWRTWTMTPAQSSPTGHCAAITARRTAKGLQRWEHHMGLYMHGGTPKWMVNLVSFMENPIKKWMISNYPLSTGMCRVVLSSTKGFAQRLGPRDPRIDWPSFAGCPITYPNVFSKTWASLRIVGRKVRSFPTSFWGAFYHPSYISDPSLLPTKNQAIPNGSSGGFLK